MAARVYTGAHIRDSTLTTVDFKNKNLTTIDFKAGRIGALGAKGPIGDQGTKGTKGFRGTQGTPGVDGNAAVRQFSYSYRDADGRFLTTIDANDNIVPWWVRNSVSSLKQPGFLTAAGAIMTDLAQSQQSGGVLNLTRASDVIVNTTVTLAHRGDPLCRNTSTLATMPTVNMNYPTSKSNTCGTTASNVIIDLDSSNDVNRLTRAECYTQYANADGSNAVRIGESVYVTGNNVNELVNVPLTAGTTLPPGSYTFRTICRAADRSPNFQHDDWEFVHANMSVLTAADNLGS